MSNDNDDLIDQITYARMSNNGLWMLLLQIALEAAPEKAKPVLRDINENDQKISGLLRELAK